MVDLSSPAAERSEKEKRNFLPSFPRSGREGGRAQQRPGESTKRAKATLAKKSRKSFHPINQGSDK
jgi:hypothetical protein